MMTSYDPALIFLPIANEILVLNSEVQEEGETELVFCQVELIRQLKLLLLK